MAEEEQKQGKVWLVGAGCGDLGLVTQKGMKVLKEAEVVVYDALLSLELLSMLPEDAELIDVGKRSHHHQIPQEEINRILLKKAQQGKRVVRLKGGDPFVFGRGGEELELLCQEQIPYEIVPGVTSPIAVLAYNGIPITHRDYSSSFHVITGHRQKNKDLDINFKALSELQGTLVFLMGVAALENICNRLIEAGMRKDMPAAMLEQGTTSRQKRVVATVSTLKAAADKAGIKSPAVIVVGKVCELEKDFAWFEKKPLFGRQIVVTRPREKSSRLSERLRDLGAQVVELPAIYTTPVMATANERAKNRFQTAVREFCREQRAVCAVFTSPQGVEHFFRQLKRQKIDMRQLLANPNLTFAVLGTGTKKALENYNLFADYMPEIYSAEELGKRLASSLAKDTKVYLFRAMEGTKALTQRLAKAEIPYEDIPVYETEYKQHRDIMKKTEQALEQGEITDVTFTSASTVKGFVGMITNVDYTKINAVCIGQETAKEAAKYGMQISVSKEASIDSMVELLLSKKI
ncbi:MAG: uroporphyrinogen-III C-methyltransferase [Lachnospiraceae bacterium]|nr:uroporphyrinogen-III C-methyltransferase [Lachnospiraceae bacterium]